MGEEKNQQPSQKVQLQKKPWFWPVFYVGCSILFVGMIFTYNALTKEEVAPGTALVQEATGPALEVNTRAESLKYPFAEANLENIQVLQDFYDVTADAKTRENALMVFNQTFSTSSGVSLSLNGEAFEVIAALSGEVAEVKLDAFTGNSILLNHTDGTQTRYSSVSDIKVKAGDKVEQGQPIGKASANEWNPSAGVHLHFEVLEDGVPVNPRKVLSF